MSYMMDLGKFFVIRSQMNGMVLDVKDANCCPGNPVVMWDYNGSPNQLWYEDHVAGVIRSAMSDEMVLDVQGNCLMLNYLSPGDVMQRWMNAGDRVQNRDTGAVLDIANNDMSAGARVCAWDYHGSANQMFTFDYQQARLCRIRSTVDERCLDVKGAKPDPETRVIVYDINYDNPENQLFWEDCYGLFHSKLTGMVLDSYDRKLRMMPVEPGKPTQQWVRHGNRVVNKFDPATCLDIKGGSGGKDVIHYEYKGGDNQHWMFEYL